MMSSNNADYSFSDIMIDAPILPVTFVFSARAIAPMKNMLATHVDIRRRLTNEELEIVVLNTRNNIQLSQHSFIVANKEVPEKAMVYDLAIGECQAFEYPNFWAGLLLSADWRQAANPVKPVQDYYTSGVLPYDFKHLMNKPERERGIPRGNFGVVNDYAPSKAHVAQADADAGNLNTELQWAMPKPLV